MLLRRLHEASGRGWLRPASPSPFRVEAITSKEVFESLLNVEQRAIYDKGFVAAKGYATMALPVEGSEGRVWSLHLYIYEHAHDPHMGVRLCDYHGQERCISAWGSDGSEASDSWENAIALLVRVQAEENWVHRTAG